MPGTLLKCHLRIHCQNQFVQKLKEKDVQIPIEYEWVPPSRQKCKSFGYIYSQCLTKQTWLPKISATIQEEETSGPPADDPHTHTVIEKQQIHIQDQNISPQTQPDSDHAHFNRSA